MIEKRRYRLRTRGLPATRAQWAIYGSALLCGLASPLVALLTHGLLAHVSLVVASLALVTMSGTVLVADRAVRRSDAARSPAAIHQPR